MNRNARRLFSGIVAALVIVCELLAASRVGYSASNVTFRKVVSRRNGCTLVYGGLSFGGKDFFLEECGDVWNVLKVFDIGYVKQLQFTTEATAWAIVGGSLAKLEFQGQEISMTVAKRESDDIYLEDVFFANESNGWACGRNGMILKTSDSGQTWSKIASKTTADLYRVRFTDNDFGWILPKRAGTGDELHGYLKTSDGGLNWNLIPPPKAKDFSSAFFTSSVHGCGVAGRREVICTSDGNFWNSIKLADENRGQIFFINSRTGWIAGDAILKTSNGGKTWKYVLKQPSGGGLFLDDIYFATETHGWAWGPTSVYETKDGGTTWEHISDKWLSSLTALR